MKQTKKAYILSALSVVLCIALLIGTTFAWFTDSVTSSGNTIKAGNLDIKMYWTDDPTTGNWHDVEDPQYNKIFNYDNWEPGYTEVKYIKIKNEGSLALNYQLQITPINGVGKLAEVINVYFANKAVSVEERSDLSKLGSIGLLNTVLEGGATASGTILADGQVGSQPSGEVILTFAMNMLTTAGNEYQNESVGDGFGISAIATQATFENDSFGSNYDVNAEYPVLIIPRKATAPVAPVDNKVPDGGITISDGDVSAKLPAGTKLNPGVTEVTLTINPLKSSTSKVVPTNSELLIPVDVHIEGVASDNTVPIEIDLGSILPKYLNMGNYSLYHVENGVSNQMSLVDSKAELSDHNDFVYDPETGATSVAMATFSEVSLLVDMSMGWKGGVDTTWYNSNKTSFTIYNADQLNGLSRIVGGMEEFKDKRDTFEGKTIKLISDINLADGEVYSNGEVKVFYPIGYYNNQYKYFPENQKQGIQSVESSVSSFKGTFDGNGHTISNFYQNTWEMFGDYNDGYAANSNHYKDAMGLFGYVNGGTVKNLTVDHFSSDGEFTPTGCVAAYACDATFQNIAITNCNPRVYNTGNGGIVGIGGNSEDPDSYKLTFNNITVDNSNKITALWGSWDVACGGLVGMFRGAGHAYMTNCHVAAQIDVYNDVCGNYQYYWYRYSGMLIGTNKNMITDANGYTVPETDKFHAANCTVNFGDWNNYYYCELVANSLASYTHDHQFSRLSEINSLSEIKNGETWLKTGNFLLIEGDNKTCYHIVNKDGVLTEHKHTDSGYEDSIDEDKDGKADLKEDKQIVYLRFNQLFTGYGWGVKHIPIYDNDDDNVFDGVTILKDQATQSIEKFEKNTDTCPLRIEPENGYTWEIGKLFKAIDNNSPYIPIMSGQVQVFVSPKTSDEFVSGSYAANGDDWKKGTITFSGSGTAVVTITDYYFCKTTTIEIFVAEDTDMDMGEEIF